ncbi:hypothetical protein [Stenotrophomonas sp. NPDC077659]|uniref:hypothetical protein n=1 Tax=Stenotrophomonas sp. NPDC077659 TaxID=3390694 RepID=UPI003D00EE30
MKDALCYSLFCAVVSILMSVAIPGFIWDIYQFDTAGGFSWLYSAGLICFGLLLKPHHGKTVLSCASKGLIVGTLAGILAQVVVALAEHERFSVLNASLAGQLLLSIFLMSILFVTPLWGGVASGLTFYVVSRGSNAEPS